MSEIELGALHDVGRGSGWNLSENILSPGIVTVGVSDGSEGIERVGGRVVGGQTEILREITARLRIFAQFETGESHYAVDLGTEIRDRIFRQQRAAAAYHIGILSAGELDLSHVVSGFKPFLSGGHVGEPLICFGEIPLYVVEVGGIEVICVGIPFFSTEAAQKGAGLAEVAGADKADALAVDALRLSRRGERVEIHAFVSEESVGPFMVEEERIGSCRRHAGGKRRRWESPQEVGGHVGTARVTESGKSFREKPSALFGIISGTRVVVAGAGHSCKEAELVKDPGEVSGAEHFPGTFHKTGGGRRETVWRGGSLRRGWS